MRAGLSSKPKLKKCAVSTCKAPFIQRSMSHRACSPACAVALVTKQREKKERAAKTIERKQIAERKAKLKTRSDHMKEAQQIFNTWRREYCKSIGITTCICCDEPLDWNANKVDAGHYRSVGSAPHLRFIENNVWPQRKQCNQYGAGRAVDYRIGLIARIGLAAVEALEADNTPRKFTVEQLLEIKTIYRAKLKALREANA